MLPPFYMIDIRKQILDPDEAYYFERSLAEGEGDDLTILHDVSTEAIAKVSRNTSTSLEFNFYSSIGNQTQAKMPFCLRLAGSILSRCSLPATSTIAYIRPLARC